MSRLSNFYKLITIVAVLLLAVCSKDESNNYKQIDSFITLEDAIIQTDHPLKIKNYLKSKNLND